MPFIKFNTNKDLTIETKDTISNKIGQAITILPGKVEASLMLQFATNQTMYFKGERTDIMYINVKLYKSIAFEAKKEFTEAMTTIIEEETQICKSNIYVSFDEYENWGKQGILV